MRCALKAFALVLAVVVLRRDVPSSAVPVPGPWVRPLVAGDEILRVGGEVSEPQELSKKQPDYSADARRARLEGTVLLEAIITARGDVANLRILRTVHRLLDDASIEAVKNWKYRPATFKGRPVAVFLTVTTKFTLTLPTPRPRPGDSVTGNWQEGDTRHWVYIASDNRVFECSISRDDKRSRRVGYVEGDHITWRGVVPPDRAFREGKDLVLESPSGTIRLRPLDATMAPSCASP